MESIGVKIFLLFMGAIALEATRQVIEYIKRITPRVEYTLVSGISVNVEKKHLCGHRITIVNPSRKKVENVTFHLRTSSQKMVLEKISKPEGLECSVVDKEGGIDLTFPYIKHGEEVILKIQTENEYYVSDSLRVSVSSPNDIEFMKAAEAKPEGRPILTYILTFLLGCSCMFSFLWIRELIKVNEPHQTETKQRPFEMDRRDLVISLASGIGLPHFAELYLTSYDPKFFNEGDIAYSLAVASKDRNEIEKYRKLLSLTLGNAKEMAPESQANLYYSLGKLDLLISDDKSALSDFQNAIVKSKTTVEEQAKADTKTHKYLIDHGLL